MAEAFSNKITRTCGIVSTSTDGSIGIQTTWITGISTVGVGVSHIVDNQHFLAGTKISSIGIGRLTISTLSVASTREDSHHCGGSLYLAVVCVSVREGGRGRGGYEYENIALVYTPILPIAVVSPLAPPKKGSKQGSKFFFLLEISNEL